MYTLAEKIFLSIFLIVVIVFGVVGNTFVIAATVRFHRLRRNVSNYLLLNLAISDLLSSSVIMPYHLASVINLDIINDNGLLCQIGGTLSYPILLTSTLTLVMLAIDRFIAMSDPLRYRARITFKAISFMISYTWLHSTFFTIFTLLLVDMEFDEVSLDCGVAWQKSPLWFALLSMLLNIVFPFLFVALTSLRVLSIAKSHHKQIASEVQVYTGQGPPRNRTRGRESKATSVILMVILMFLITWSPYLVTRALRVFGIDLPSIVYTLSIWILHINAVGNFFIYSRRGQEYRQAFLAIIKRQSILPPGSEHSAF
ncbi:D(2) dopamine receptor [Exaiptasia diaphana]|uniref:G-protein coupled receptors family 1 profile domain-containing protein n=1 Tax=Exaiptasia diaphana TaxID=2652724 RepID=A0A913WRD2_EXADI|nr:D(2) dopamine receptor [Exaiptasia diaphana]